MNLPDNTATQSAGLFQLAWRLLVGAGAAAGSIGVVLSAFGFLVEHAYFDRLGVPRTLYEAKPSEYIVTGGKFLLGLVPLAVTGSAEFVLEYWWLVLIALAGALATRLRWPQGLLWIVSAAWFAAAFSLVALRLRSGPQAGQRQAVAMFTFLTVAAILYSYTLLVLVTVEKRSVPANSRLFGARIPFFAVLLSAIVALPYLRGAYAIDREYPLIEFLGKDREVFCGFLGDSPAASCADTLWELIEVGQQRALLRKAGEPRIYVVPVSSVNTFRILKKGANP